ncbi:MAG: uridylate kinase [Candidatus Parcubacteria bacterium]|nr:MAG: uridylate kinase [Candidatus Parcubacteria bacterium]
MKIFVISLGGSLTVPQEIDIKFLKKFKKIIDAMDGKKFIIIVGGGRTARNYQRAAKKIVNITNEDLDWLGIHATRLNAHLLLTIFRDKAYYRIIKNPKEKVNFKEQILIAAGWKPGFSTDYDAVLLAKTYNSNIILNLTNIDYVYDKDPNKYKDAKPFKNISWNDYLKLIKNNWIPGISVPFDPIASRLAKNLKFKVVVINGKKINNLRKFLENKKFNGTIIS